MINQISNRSTSKVIIVPFIAGAVIANVAALMLHFSYLWTALYTVGLVVALASLVAKTFKEYWLSVFAIVLPFDIKKMLIDSDLVRDITQIHGIPIGELPGPVIYLSDFPFIILMTIWVYELIQNNRKIVFPKSNKYALAFIAWASLSLINAPVFSYGLFDLLRTIKFYLLYLYISNNIENISNLKTIINYLFLGVIIQGSICLYQYLTQDISYIFGNLFGKQDLFSNESIEKFRQFFAVAPGTDLKRASGTVGPINAQAQYFEFILPSAFVLSLLSHKLPQRIFYILTSLIGFAGIVVTFSRGGFIGLGAALLATMLLSTYFKKISFQKFLAISILFLIIVVSFSPVLYNYMTSRKEAALARFHLYKVGIEMVKDNPLIGVGLNNHIVRQVDFDPDTYEFPTPTHNHYLFIASEVGIPGLVFFMSFLFSSFIYLLHSIKSENEFLSGVAIGLIGAIIAISTHNFVDHLSYHTNLTLLWLFAGLAPAIVNIRSNKLNDREQKYI